LQQHATVVVLVLIPCDQPRLAEAVDQLDGAVVADAQAFREVADRHRPAAGESLDRQQRLMLARGQAGVFRLDLAELEEAADQVAKLGQPLVVGLPDGGAWFLWLRHIGHLFVFRESSNGFEAKPA
jgi:hypothetical protein